MIDPLANRRPSEPRLGAASKQDAPSQAGTAKSRPADEGQRRHFERLLSRPEPQQRSGARSGLLDEDETQAAGDTSVWALGTDPTPGTKPSASDDPEGRPGPMGAPGQDGAGSAGSPFADLPPSAFNLTAAATDIPVPAPAFHVTEAQQARMFAHLALPLSPSAQASARFEVLEGGSGQMVSHVEVNTLPRGGITVAIGTSVQHAALMDRHLPALQQRLGDKVRSSHLRIHETDAERD